MTYQSDNYGTGEPVRTETLIPAACNASRDQDHVSEPALRQFPGPGVMLRLIALGLRLFVRPVLSVFGRFPRLRWPYALLNRLAVALPPPRRVRRQKVTLPNCGAELITPLNEATTDAAILYLHGGGFITCGLHTHRRLTADIARAAGCPALAVDYRMLPHHGMSEALADALDGFRALVERGHPADAISVVGDSAGGYLAVATALAAPRAGLGRPVSVAAMSPMTSIDPDFDIDPDAADALFPPAALRAICHMLATKPAAGEGFVPKPRLRSEDLAQLPPTLIQVGSREILTAPAVDLAHRIAAADVPCEVQIWEGQFHVFQAAAFLAAPARAAIAEIGAFLKTQTFNRGSDRICGGSNPVGDAGHAL